MAEIGIAASIVGISEFALSLSKNLYKFGCKAFAAREQTERVARNLSHYAQVISLLGDRLDEDEPIHSQKGLILAIDLCDESYGLLEKVEKLVPDIDDDGDIPWTSRLAWAFKKSRIDVLIGEIEYMKTTVNLLVQVLYAGKKVRTYRRRRSRQSSRTADANRAANVQTHQVEITLIEQFDATQALPQLINQANQEQQALLDDDDRTLSEDEKHQPSQTSLIKLDECVAQPVQLFASATGLMEDDKLLVARTQSSVLLEHLLSEWTNLDETNAMDADGTAPNRANAQSVISERQEATSSDESGRGLNPTSSQSRSAEKALSIITAGLDSVTLSGLHGENNDNASSTSSAPVPRENDTLAARLAKIMPPVPDGWAYHVDSHARIIPYVHLQTRRIDWDLPKSKPTRKDRRNSAAPILSLAPSQGPVKPEPLFLQFCAQMVPQIEASGLNPELINGRVRYEWFTLSPGNRALWEMQYSEQLREYERKMEQYQCDLGRKSPEALPLHQKANQRSLTPTNLAEDSASGPTRYGPLSTHELKYRRQQSESAAYGADPPPAYYFRSGEEVQNPGLTSDRRRSRRSRKSEKSENLQAPTKFERISSIVAGDGKQEWTRDEDDPDKFVRKMKWGEGWKLLREMATEN